MLNAMMMIWLLELLASLILTTLKDYPNNETKVRKQKESSFKKLQYQLQEYVLMGISVRELNSVGKFKGCLHA